MGKTVSTLSFVRHGGRLGRRGRRPSRVVPFSLISGFLSLGFTSDFGFRISNFVAIASFICLLPLFANAASVAPENLPRLVEKVRASVVQLHVERPKEEYDEKTPPYKRRTIAPCSGDIIDPNGFILTTQYNIGSATAVRVTLDNGKSYDAKVLGWHDGKDLAVLKIDATDLPTLHLADRSKLQVGDAVVIIGRSPSGEPSVAPGAVSATVRFNGDAMQADCAVNFTSAGGALVDKDGNLIGIAAHVSHNANWGYNSGISFGVFVTGTSAETLIAELKDGKRVTTPPRARLGVQAGESAAEGAPVGEVDAGSGADRAGMKRGDLIIEFNGQKIKSFEDLRDAIQKQKPGDEFKATVLRDGKEIELKGKLGRF
jgi:S1-C subfamily serine protease